MSGGRMMSRTHQIQLLLKETLLMDRKRTFKFRVAVPGRLRIVL